MYNGSENRNRHIFANIVPEQDKGVEISKPVTSKTPQ